MSETARQSPKFPWDHDVPDTPFWNSLDYKVGRAFLSAYDPSVLAQKTFDETLSKQEKLELLKTVLEATLSEKEKNTTNTLDHQTWNNLKLGISTMDYYLGNYAAAEQLMIERYENGPDGSKDMSALHALAALYEETGRFAEAEAAALEVLPWIQNHGKIGSRDSPQSIGCLRTLMKCVWKQGRYVEAKEWIGRAERSVEKLGEGKFAKYQVEEREYLEKEVREMEAWKME